MQQKYKCIQKETNVIFKSKQPPPISIWLNPISSSDIGNAQNKA